MSVRRPTLSDRLQRALMHGVFRLPLRVRRALAGPVLADNGVELDVDAHLLIALSRRAGVSLVVDGSVEKSRTAISSGAYALRGRQIRTVTTRDFSISGDHQLKSTLYETSSANALMVFFHGGGWVLGSTDSYDYPLRFLAHHSDTAILSVDYRLAPEHPFPAALDDAAAALDFARTHAAEWGFASGCIGVGGDSAGANISAALTHRLSENNEQQPAFAFLLYPATDFVESYPSKERFSDGFMLTNAEIDWFERHYAGDAIPSDPGLSVIRGDIRADLPPTYLATGGFDPLRDEGEAYAAKLSQVGVPVVAVRQAGLIHGYLSFVGLAPSFTTAGVDAAHELRRLAVGRR